MWIPGFACCPWWENIPLCMVGLFLSLVSSMTSVCLHANATALITGEL
ncbi:rCG22326 [Rattus norvegicus]|uniref:RCG22326 n=1 Tax=Rattus norvegicus TaxID=10116 RepID=A6ING9_RAT|nr:rCG22326 [Rattus norvegicus]